jgi:SPP1 gp7 family putative phage head morphogenesis protein
MSRLPLINSILNARQDEADSEYVLRLIKEAYMATAATSKAIERARRIAEQIRGYNQQEFYSVLRSAMQVDIFAQEPDLRRVMEEWAAENVRLIQSIPEQYFGQLQGIVSRGLTQGTLAKDMGDEIQGLYGVTNRRAQLIARDQVATLNGLISEKRQRSIGVTFYQWSTSKDARVRESHADREGRFYAYPSTGAAGTQFNGKKVLEPPSDGVPGVPIHCRCVALPVIDTEALQGGVR